MANALSNNIKANGYSEAGASRTKRALKGFTARSGSPNEDILDNQLTLRQRARMLYMASPVAQSAINVNRTKIVGVGLALKSTPDCSVLGLSKENAAQWAKKVESEFRLWRKKENCDALGLNSFYSLQQLALKSYLMSGDVFAVLKHVQPTPLNPYSLRVHLVEADRISTPTAVGVLLSQTEGKNPDNNNRIYDGVEIDQSGKVVAYHIRNTYPFQISSEQVKWTRVEATGSITGLPNVLHIMEAERPDQYRGVTYLASVIEPLLQMRRYTESELMSAIIQTLFTAWIETETDTSENPFNEVGSGIPTENPSDSVSNDPNEYEMGAGTVLRLKRGEKVVFGNPNIPTAGFEVFVKTVARLIGAGLEIPYDVLMKEFNASYSASRGALMEFWSVVKMRRSWFVSDFCQPIYECWLAEAIALGRIKAPGFWDDPLIRSAWCGAKWIGPTQGQLDPKKEAEAALLLVDRGVKTHEQVTRELGGGDWENNVSQLQRENELLRMATGEGITAPNQPEEGDGINE